MTWNRFEQRWLCRVACVALLTVAAIVPPRGPAVAAVRDGVWLIDAEVAVRIYDCDDLLCGQVVWLSVPRDSQGQLQRDRNNPDLTLRGRELCGLTILWGLRQMAPDAWSNGRFYNPQDGRTYNVSAQARSADVIRARIYVVLPLFGRTKILRRIPHGTSEGWC